MRFDDIKGQEAAIGILRRAARSGRVPHAYLFAGPPGVGKHLAARALAMALNCETDGALGCTSCRSCRKIDADVHPDLLETELPPKKKRIPVDSVRTLEQRLAVRAHEGRAKLAIIDPADLMTEPAANALLKTLEEPRPGAFLVLITTRAAALLPTVRSRCQLVRFRPLPQEVIAKILVQAGEEESRASTVAALCNGSLERAAELTEGTLERRLEAASVLLESAASATPERGLEQATSLKGGKGARDEVTAVLDVALLLLHELLHRSCSIHTGDGPLEQFVERRLAPHLGALPPHKISLQIAAIHRTQEGLHRNFTNPQLALEGMLMSLRGRRPVENLGSGFGAP